MVKLFKNVMQFFKAKPVTVEPKNILLGKRIKDVRINKNITQHQLAKKLNVNRRTVSRWESGTHIPQTTHLQQIAKLAGKGIIWLLYNEDYSQPFNSIKEVA